MKSLPHRFVSMVDNIINQAIRYLSDSFNAKFDASMREYEYLLPLHILTADLQSFDIDSHYSKLSDATITREVR